MAQRINQQAEEKVLVTITDGESEVSRFALGAARPDLFGVNEAEEVYVRLSALVGNGNSIPSLAALSEDPILSDQAKTFVQNIQHVPLKSKEDAQFVVDTLERHWHIRVASRNTREFTDLMEMSDADSFRDKAIPILQRTLNGLQETATKRFKYVTFGAGDSALGNDAVGRIIDPDDHLIRIPTGFQNFDGRSSGFRKPNLVTIAGPTGGGKTALATQIAINAYSKARLRTGYLSLEMSEDECYTRIFSNLSEVPFEAAYQRIMTAKQRARFVKASMDFDEIGKNDTRAQFGVLSTEDITAEECINYFRPMNLDILVVDYLGLLKKGNEEAKHEHLDNAARHFKNAAKSLNCCVVQLAQFDSKAEQVRYSRAIVEHSDVLWTWIYGKKEEETGVVRIRQTKPHGKNRNSRPFDFPLKFSMDIMRVDDWSGPMPEEGDTAAPPQQGWTKGSPGGAKNAPPQKPSGPAGANANRGGFHYHKPLEGNVVPRQSAPMSQLQDGNKDLF